jgi:hypothetical protein
MLRRYFSIDGIHLTLHLLSISNWLALIVIADEVRGSKQKPRRLAGAEKEGEMEGDPRKLQLQRLRLQADIANLEAEILRAEIIKSGDECGCPVFAKFIADTVCPEPLEKEKPCWFHPQASRSLPKIYRTAAWRNTTRVNAATGCIGIGFETANGISRLSLDVTSAKHLAESVLEYLEDHRTRSHSPMSEGSPNLEGSPQEGQSV